MFDQQLAAAELRLQAAEAGLAAGGAPDQVPIIQGRVAILRSIMLRNVGDLPRAITLAQHGLNLLPVSEAIMRGVATLNLARAYEVSGDVTATSEQLAAQVVARVRAAGNLVALVLISFADLARKRRFAPQLLACVTAINAQFRLAEGDLSAAERWMETSGLGLDDALSYPREREYLTFARVLIAQRQLAAALRLLDRLLQDAEAKARMHSAIEILILQALACHAQGAQDAGLVALARALVLAEPEGYVRSFVDEGLPMVALLAQSLERRAPDDPISVFVERLLSAFQVEHSVAHLIGPGDAHSGPAIPPFLHHLVEASPPATLLYCW